MYLLQFSWKLSKFGSYRTCVSKESPSPNIKHHLPQARDFWVCDELTVGITLEFYLQLTAVKTAEWAMGLSVGLMKELKVSLVERNRRVGRRNQKEDNDTCLLSGRETGQGKGTRAGVFTWDWWDKRMGTSEKDNRTARKYSLPESKVYLKSP